MGGAAHDGYLVRSIAGVRRHNLLVVACVACLVSISHHDSSHYSVNLLFEFG